MSQQLWYTLYTKPRRETQVYQYLAGVSEVEAFYPYLTVKPANPRSSRIRPYFPGYLFVRADLEAVGESLLQWIPGAHGIVRFGGEPAVVPEHLIYIIKQQIERLRADTRLLSTDLRQGELVEITEGAFAGYEAIFDMQLSGQDRVQVLLAWLGQQIRVQVSAHALRRPRRRGSWSA